MPSRVSRKKVTLKAIAERLGVTVATVSKALRDSTDISREMKARVRAVAEEMGYHPNLLARSLARKRSNLLGVIIPDVNISYYADLVQGIFENAHERGYESIIMFHHESPEKERRSLQFLYSLQVDGVLVNTTNGAHNRDFLLKLQSEAIPVVCYDREIEDGAFNVVTIDEERAMTAVLRTLARNGRRNVAYVGPTEGEDVTVRRFQAYQQQRADFGLSSAPELVVSSESSVRSAEVELGHRLRNGLKPDAVVCCGGLVAFGAGKALLNAGFRMPDDVLLVEYGDNNLVQRLAVSYLAVNESPYEMSRLAVELMDVCLSAPPEDWKPRRLCVPTKLVYYDHTRHAEEILETVE